MIKNFLALAIAGSLAAAVVVAQSTPPPSTFYGCKDSVGNITTIREGTAPTCKRGQTLTSWNNQGPQGLPGANGQDGTPGGHVWKDANGQIIGPAIVSEAGGMVELTVGSRRFAIRVPTLLEPHPNGWAPNNLFGGFLHYGAQSFAPRYSLSADCSGPFFYAVNDSTPLGFDNAYVLNSYDSIGEEAGRIDLLILSEDPGASAITSQCVVMPDGSQSVQTNFIINPRYQVVQTINLTDLYPAPLTLQ